MHEIRLKRYYYFRKREQFTFAQENHAYAVMMIPEQGSFVCRIEDEEGGLSKECIVRFGQFYLGLAGQTLHRRVIETINAHFFEFDCSALKLSHGKYRISDTDRLTSTLAYLLKWAELDPLIRGTEEAEHYIRDLLLMAVHTLKQAEHNRLLEPEPIMLQANALIRQQACDSSFSLQEIAARLSISPSQLTRRFQTAYSQSPIQFATRIRLSKARTLLAETNLSLEQIAEHCGYQNAFYFSRIFARTMKLPPSDYRKANRI